MRNVKQMTDQPSSYKPSLSGYKRLLMITQQLAETSARLNQLIDKLPDEEKRQRELDSTGNVTIKLAV